MSLVLAALHVAEDRRTGEGVPRVEDLLRNAIIVDKDLIIELYTGFEKVMRFVGGLLYTSAKKAGHGMARRMAERGFVGEGNAVEVLLWSFVASGYAEEVKVSRVEVGKKDTTIELEAHGTLLGSRLKSKKPVDQPLAGFLAGWIEEVLGARVDAREVACQARGDPACVFVIKVKKPLPELKRLEGRVFRAGGAGGA